jgi:hypothetical protein
MIRLVPAAIALAAFAVPLAAATHRVVAGVGLVGLLLVAVGIVALWRWPFSAAAAVFLGEYGAALLLAGDAPPSLVASVGFGLAILLLLQSSDLAVRARRAIGGLAVLRAQLARWLVLGGGGLAGAALSVGLAIVLAPLLAAAAAPFLAGAAALGIVVVAAAIVVRAARRRAHDG